MDADPTEDRPSDETEWITPRETSVATMNAPGCNDEEYNTALYAPVSAVLEQ